MVYGDTMTDQLTRAQLRKILKAIRAVADIDKATRNAIVCALVGHSRIQRDVGDHIALVRGVIGLPETLLLPFT